MNILISGSGLIAQVVAKYFSNINWNVDLLTLADTFHGEPILTSTQGTKTVYERSYDVYVYASGSTSLQTAEENSTLDREIHIQAMNHHIKWASKRLRSNATSFLISSGGAVYGEYKYQGINKTGFMEEDTTSPISSYGKRNKDLEQVFQEACNSYNSYILRASNPFTCAQFYKVRQGLVVTLINSGLQNKPINLRDNGAQIRNYFHVDLIPITIQQILSQQSLIQLHSVYNCGSTYSCSTLDMAKIVEELLGHKLELHLDQIKLPYEVRDATLDCTRLANLFAQDNYIYNKYLSKAAVVKSVEETIYEIKRFRTKFQ